MFCWVASLTECPKCDENNEKAMIFLEIIIFSCIEYFFFQFSKINAT